MVRLYLLVYSLIFSQDGLKPSPPDLKRLSKSISPFKRNNSSFWTSKISPEAHNSCRDGLQATHLSASPVCREGKENGPYFKENLSKALPRNSWHLLLLAVLRVHVAPRSGLRLSSEMASGRPFLTIDIVLDVEVSWTLWYITTLGQVHKAIYDYAHKALLTPTKIQRKEQFLHK